MNKKGALIICFITIFSMVFSSCQLISIPNNDQVVELNKDSHFGHADVEVNSGENVLEENDISIVDDSDIPADEVTDWDDETLGLDDDEDTYWDDEYDDWDDSVTDWDDDEYIDWYDDEIVDPDDFEEIPWVITYEYGDWTMGYTEGGNWSAWKYHGNDETVTIPTTYNGEQVKEVGVWAFWDNKDLKHVIIPEGITVINENCFMGCENLETAELPSHVDFFGDQLFSDCSSLKRCVVPDGVTELDYRQFSDCTSLEEVVLPSGMTLIGEAAFVHCYNLKTIYFRGSEADWKAIEISSNALSDSNYTLVLNYDGD